MKRMDIFCASHASTAICLSMDQAASSSSSPACSSASAIQLGGRAIDRHNPIIKDSKRFTRTLPSNPCTSQPPPINPLPYHQLKKNNEKKSSTTKSKNPDHTKKSSSNSSAVSAKSNDHKKKSSSKNSSSLKPTDNTISRKSTFDIKDADGSRKSFAKAVDFVTPPGSSRYLLGDSAFFDGISDYDPVWALVPGETKNIQAFNNQDQSIVSSKPSSSSSSSSSSSRSEKPSTDQVVVLRVSLHCKGCEGKVRKHLSRMKGVTSFSIDFAAKKVTIVGDVTPLGVLASVSKVKSAQFWTSTNSANSSASPALGSSNVSTKK